MSNNDMYQVRAYVQGQNILARRPIFSTVQAPSAAMAKQKVREALVEENPNIQIKRMTATPVF